MKHWGTVIKLLIAAALVTFVVHQVGLDRLLEKWKNIDKLLFLAGAAFLPIGISFSALRWRWLLRVNELDLSVGQALRFTWIGVFFSNVVPGLTGGDVIKAVYVAKATGKKLRPVLSVLVDRVMGLLGLAVVAAVAALFWIEDERFIWLAAGLWGGLVLLGLGVALFLSRRVRKLVRLDALLRKLPGKDVLMQFDQALTLYRGHMPGMALWLGLSSLNHVFSLLGWVLINEALHGHMSWSSVLVLVPISQILTAIPLAPGGWGIGEFSIQWLWGQFGPAAVSVEVMKAEGTALSIIYRIHQMLWSLIGALSLVISGGRPSSEEMKQAMDDPEHYPTPST